MSNKTVRLNVQPAYPYSQVQPKIPTHALMAGDWVWTQAGPREVLAVELGDAGGWRLVQFEDGTASVPFTHPWEIAAQCGYGVGGNPASGCEEWALREGDYCKRHNALED